LIDEETQLINEDRPIMMTMISGWNYLLRGDILLSMLRKMLEIKDTMTVTIEEAEAEAEAETEA